MRLRRRKGRPHQASPSGNLSEARIAKLEQRLAHLEAAFEGLQDAVYRESSRHDKRLDELVKTSQPAAIARALSDDARRRGL
jgi:uncharacterized coiled-coil protein SlyX